MEFFLLCNKYFIHWKLFCWSAMHQNKSVFVVFDDELCNKSIIIGADYTDIDFTSDAIISPMKN